MNQLRHIAILPLLILSTMAMSLDVCCQIAKFPNLLTHFAEHKALDGDTVFEFVVEDYIDHGSGSNHHDENSHEDLPFHGNHTCSHAPIYFSALYGFLVIQSDTEKIEGRSFYNFLFTSPALGELFQPPQG
jgi:hypothetical protein